MPPPIFTACFSSIRSPGVVLRVSRTCAPVPSISFTYLSVMVAMPLMRCMILSIRRSVCNRERTLPDTTKAMSPFFTREPSSKKTSICIVGSKRLNTLRAMSTPANIPSSLMRRWLLPIASSGMQQSVVWSPSPMSSAKARSIRASSSSFTDNMLFRFDLFPVVYFHQFAVALGQQITWRNGCIVLTRKGLS